MENTAIISFSLLVLAILVWVSKDKNTWQFLFTSTKKQGEIAARTALVEWISGCTKSIKIIVGRVNLEMYNSEVVIVLKNLIVHQRVHVEIICEVDTITYASPVFELVHSKMIKLYRTQQTINEHILIGDDNRHMCWDSDDRPAKPFRLSISNTDPASVNMLLYRYNELN